MKVSHALAPACLFSLLSCASAFALDANEEITDPAQGFDYLVYSVTWQPSFCVLKPDTAGCATPPQRFLTHGIWPYKNSTTEKTNRHPAFCNTAPGCQSTQACDISEDNLAQVTRELTSTNLVPDRPEAMFRHEWKKHGSCSGKSDRYYFADIVNLRKVVTFNQDAFNRVVGSSVVFSDLKRLFPENTSFRCFVRDNKQYLHEVFYLIDTQGKPYTTDKRLQIGIACNEQPTYVPGGA